MRKVIIEICWPGEDMGEGFVYEEWFANWGDSNEQIIEKFRSVSKRCPIPEGGRVIVWDPPDYICNLKAHGHGAIAKHVEHWLNKDTSDVERLFQEDTS